MAANLCLLGANNEELARVFGTSPQILYRWFKRHPELAEACKRGRELADGEVASSLYRQATGYTRIEKKKVRSDYGESTYEDVEVYYPPNVVATKFWLSCRRPHEWTETIKVDQSYKVSIAMMDAESLKKELEARELEFVSTPQIDVGTSEVVTEVVSNSATTESDETVKDDSELPVEVTQTES